jgi:hypothetical protein
MTEKATQHPLQALLYQRFDFSTMHIAYCAPNNEIYYFDI